LLAACGRKPAVRVFRRSVSDGGVSLITFVFDNAIGPWHGTAATWYADTGCA
jgi:hypothetical protein